MERTQYAIARDLPDACSKLLEDMSKYRPNKTHAHWCYELASFNEAAFFHAVRGTWRVAFRSRDRQFALFGLSAADLVWAKDTETSIDRVVTKAQSLESNQYYIGGKRFDENGAISPEWEHFGKLLFIMPLLLVIEYNSRRTITLSFRGDGHLSWQKWLDDAASLLMSVQGSRSATRSNIVPLVREGVSPRKEEYYANISRALNALSESPDNRKVVLGRRRSIIFRDPVEPLELYLRLMTKSKNAFLFFFDNGRSDAFFGGSPELLYRRINDTFETEALAGTRPKALVHSDDLEVRASLLNSFKDKQEHALVCNHIEEKLLDFGITNLHESDLEIMALPYVLHLVKRYRGKIASFINDAAIITALHPTPAVCGVSTHWSKDFIRAHEGFDRGFYAGPIGYIGKDDVEFAVAIRSALLHEQALFIYAASGIVLGSIGEQEWEELNNKEKNILSIFEDELIDESL